MIDRPIELSHELTDAFNDRKPHAQHIGTGWRGMASSCGLRLHNRGGNAVKCNKRMHRIETFHHSSHIISPAILLTRECEMGKNCYCWPLIGVLGLSVHAFAFRENSHFQLPMRLIMRKTWKTLQESFHRLSLVRTLLRGKLFHDYWHARRQHEHWFSPLKSSPWALSLRAEFPLALGNLLGGSRCNSQ